MTIDISVIGGLVVAAIALLTFWMALSSRITKADLSADEAVKAATEAKTEAKEALAAVAVQAASLASYREQIAREYIHREVMREVEERLTAVINGLSARLDRVLEQRAAHAEH